jgi:hypothetical protein
MPRVLFALLACAVGVSGAQAADPPSGASVSHADLDRIAVEVLKDLHNRGADLYNAADAAGAVRVYETTLRAVGPFLAHRPKVRAAVADGLAEALKLDGAKAQAYRLHEVIDRVRTELKGAAKGDDPTAAKPVEAERKPEPPAVGALSGVLTLDGQPVPKADVTLVSLTLPQPRVFTAATDIDGKFAFPAELPVATYAVMVTGGVKPLPARCQSTMTSGVQVVVKAGSQTADVSLQSK